MNRGFSECATEYMNYLQYCTDGSRNSRRMSLTTERASPAQGGASVLTSDEAHCAASWGLNLVCSLIVSAARSFIDGQTM
jgi:hypothetical protein